MILSNIYKNAISGAFVLLGLASLSSCTDDNDWGTDASHDRLFRPTDLSVTPLEDGAEVSFKRMPNTDSYIIEYSTDSLYNDIPMGGTAHSVVDSSFISSPATINNLNSNTEYFIRIKGRNDAGKHSNWTYLDSYKFKTKTEQIITGVDVTPNSATVNFVAGKSIDAIYVYKSSEDSTKVDFTADDIQAGKVTINNLKSNSSYKVKLWNNNHVRGTYAFKTTEVYPEGYEVVNVTMNDDLSTLLRQASTDKVVVVLPQNDTYLIKSAEGTQKGVTIPSNIKSVCFWGASGAVSTWNVKEVKIEGEKDLIRFYNLNLENNANTADYIVNVTGNDNIGAIKFDKCNISNTRGVVRLQKSVSPEIGEISFDNCIISNIGSFGVATCKDAPNAKVGSVNITNSTVVGISGAPMIAVTNSITKVNVSQCTLFNAVVSGKYLIETNKNANIVPNFSNTLIGQKTALADATATSYKNTPFENVYYTKEYTWKSSLQIGEAADILSSELWVTPSTTNFNFTIQDKYQSKYGRLGDPRWFAQ